MANKLRFTLPILAAFLFMGFIGVTHAAPGGNVTTKIESVIFDYTSDPQTLTISGMGLSDVLPPIVTLGGSPPLKVTLFAPDSIEAEFVHSSFGSGDFLLTVDPISGKGIKWRSY